MVIIASKIPVALERTVTLPMILHTPLLNTISAKVIFEPEDILLLVRKLVPYAIYPMFVINNEVGL